MLGWCMKSELKERDWDVAPMTVSVLGSTYRVVSSSAGATRLSKPPQLQLKQHHNHAPGQHGSIAANWAGMRNDAIGGQWSVGNADIKSLIEATWFRDRSRMAWVPSKT
eukprot:92389-Amphidinium_carterae.2